MVALDSYRIASLSGAVEADFFRELDYPRQQELIPGLRRPLALRCLARVPREDHALLVQVSSSWREAIESGELQRLRKALGIDEPWIYITFCSGRFRTGCRFTTWLEGYDPKLNMWHNLGPLPGLSDSQTLKGFAFVAIGDKLYVIGGRICTQRTENGAGPCAEIDLEVRREMFVYNCTTAEWKQCASMSTPRVNFACTVCGGSIYVAGGRSLTREKGVSSAEVYLPDKDCWLPLPNMSTGRYKCVGVTSEGKIHIVGGFAGPEDSEIIHPYTIDRSCVDVFHPSEGKWELLKGMWQLDVPPNQIVTVEGRLYSSGDALTAWKGRIEEYDTELNMWKIVEGSWLPMTHPEECQNSERRYLTMAPIGNRLYFMGGYRLLSNTSSSLHTIYIFDTTAKDAASQWQMVEPVEDICKELCSHCCVVNV